MKFIADFHIHSHHSIATSKKLTLPYLEYWARIKGINLIGTGDCVHPGWFAELKEGLHPEGNGLYTLKEKYRLQESKQLRGDNIPERVYFILTGEISNIYKKNDRVRKVHNLCVFSDLKAVAALQEKLDKVGNIASDGRPILGLDSKILLDMTLATADDSYLIPAHIWTPWFSVLGSKSGFDRIEECYEDLTDEIFAVETGLSSDPAMNRVCSFLDRFTLVSNSDAHSPEKLGREANLFDTDLSFSAVKEALKSGEGFLGTIEFFPQEGKYHYDGHRKCGICWDPAETIAHNGTCPVCGKKVTRGVMYRVAELADRDDFGEELNKKEFSSITPLPELIAELVGLKSAKSKRVQAEFFRLIQELGPEFHILLRAETAEIAQKGSGLLAEGIKRLRRGEVIIEEGFDGEFGKVRVFREDERGEAAGKDLFAQDPSKGIETKIYSGYKISFDINRFQALKADEEHNQLEESIPPANIGDDKKATGKGANAEQKKGIEHDKGPCLVIAGPGTGKTWLLTERILHLVEDRHVPPEEILALTFSNRAAGELRERVKKRLPTSDLLVSTFHSLGLSILKEFPQEAGLSPGFAIIDDDDKLDIIGPLIDEKRKLRAAIKDIFVFKQGRNTEEDISELLLYYRKELNERNLIDLDDLIYLPVRLLTEKIKIRTALRARYTHILVDEIQDTNARQLELISLFVDKSAPGLFLIGDPDQAIYGFRGADRHIVRSIEKAYPSISIINLEQSYRCPGTLLRAAGQILGKDGHAQGTDESVKLRVQETATARSEADWIAAEIEGMIGGVRSFSIDSGMSDGQAHDSTSGFSDFAVLCRASFLFSPFETAFKDHGIPYHRIGTAPFFQEEPYRSAVRSFKKVITGADETGLSPGVTHDLKEMIHKKDTIADILKFLLILKETDNDAIDRLYSFSEKFGTDYHSFLETLSIRTGSDEYDPRAEAVRLMTIHAAKGLEFDTVFIPGCEEGIIPLTLFGKKDEDERAEEERLLYVGITRAKKNCILTHARSRLFRGRKLAGGASPFLDTIEKSLLLEKKRKGKKRKEDDGQMSLF